MHGGRNKLKEHQLNESGGEEDYDNETYHHLTITEEALRSVRLRSKKQDHTPLHGIAWQSPVPIHLPHTN